MNSMDSGDSGCTMGATEGQSNHAASSSSELIVWEIEVPKVSRQSRTDVKKKQKQNKNLKLKASLTPRLFLTFQSLVGRLIGKQGRYISYLKQNSGVKIYISTLPYTQEFQICHIEGRSDIQRFLNTSWLGTKLTYRCRCRYTGAGR